MGRTKVKDLNDAFEKIVRSLRTQPIDKWQLLVLFIHAFNLSQGYICNFAKGGNKARTTLEESKLENVIIEVPTELPLEWL